MEIKYYEIEFDNNIKLRNRDEVIGGCSICIIGEHKPTFEEAEMFCKKDMKNMGYKHVVAIREISSEEAHTFFDMENEKEFPVFK